MKKLAALIFDVDGTLYHQKRLRRAMLLKLARAYALRPFHGRRTLRILSAYRRAQESIREIDTPHPDLAEAQIAYAVTKTGMAHETVRECVAHWMEREPLPLLARLVHPALTEVLETARQRGIRLAVVSDYPSTDKLRAMGLADYFEIVVAAQEPEVGLFKPHPRGIQIALDRLGVSAEKALYIGDRPEVDAIAAQRAGVSCVIVGGAGATPSGGEKQGDRQEDWQQVANYHELHKLLFD